MVLAWPQMHSLLSLQHLVHLMAPRDKSLKFRIRFMQSSDNWQLKCIKSAPEIPVPVAPRFVIGNTEIF